MGLSGAVGVTRDFSGVSLRVADLVFTEVGRVIAKGDEQDVGEWSTT